MLDTKQKCYFYLKLPGVFKENIIIILLIFKGGGGWGMGSCLKTSNTCSSEKSYSDVLSEICILYNKTTTLTGFLINDYAIAPYRLHVYVHENM